MVIFTVYSYKYYFAGAIVNAANEKLVFGDGIAGALYEAGGEIVQRECDSLMNLYANNGIQSLPGGSATIAPSGQIRTARST